LENIRRAPGGYMINQEKKYLINLARESLAYYFKTGRVLTVASAAVPASCTEDRGVFVTLTKAGSLRGCIGYILPHGPLYQSVIDNALNAALDDPRFPPVAADELQELKIEISILSLPEELKVNSPSEFLARLKPGVDGVILRQGLSQATYLPQVWQEFKASAAFLDSLCLKAGLAPGCWQEPQTSILTYQAEVFGEAG